MIPIPVELLEQFERGNVLLFIGEQLLSDVAGRATIDELTAELVARTQIDHEEELDFPAIAQVYQDQQNRHALVQFVCERLEEPEHKPQPVHHLVAQLNVCRIIVTTCLDQRLGEQEWHLEILQSQRQVLPAARAARRSLPVWPCWRTSMSRPAARSKAPAPCSGPRSTWMTSAPRISLLLWACQCHKYPWPVSRNRVPSRGFAFKEVVP